MLREQKENILQMRADGQGYAKIAEAVVLPVNTVKSYCRRNGLTNSALKNGGVCKHCGRPICGAKKSKPKKFCSDACRMAWWTGHRDQMTKKAVYLLTCIYCGKAFESYGNKKRKYCSHRCYIADRFGGNGEA